MSVGWARSGPVAAGPEPQALDAARPQVPTTSYAAAAAGEIPGAGGSSLPQQSEGLTLLAAALVRVAQEQLVPRRDPLIRDVFDAYLLSEERAGNLSAGTLAVNSAARRSLWPLLEGVKSSDMSQDLTTRLLTDMQAPPCSLRASTAKTRLGRLRRAWTWALVRRMVERPWAAPEKQRGRKARAQAKKEPYTVKQLFTLQASLDGVHHLAVRLLAETGARCSEITGLDVGDVRHDGGRWWAFLTDAKSHMPRRVPLLDETVDLLDLDRPRASPLLLGPRGGRRLNVDCVRQVVAQALDQHGIRRRVGPSSASRSWSHDLHSLRRTFASHARDAGVPGPVVDVLCGWQSRAMRDHYGRHGVREEQLVDAVTSVAAWRRERLIAQVLAQPALLSRSWSQASPVHKGLPRAQQLGAVEAAPRTSVFRSASRGGPNTQRLAVKRAAVRAAGCRGLLLHAQPEVFSHL